jgi:hypothetical protein
MDKPQVMKHAMPAANIDIIYAMYNTVISVVSILYILLISRVCNITAILY